MSLYMQVCVWVCDYMCLCVWGVIRHPEYLFWYTSCTLPLFGVPSFLSWLLYDYQSLLWNLILWHQGCFFVLATETMRRMSEQDGGVNVRFLIFSFLCTTGVSWFTCSDTQPLFNTGSKTETQYEAGSLVKQQQVKDAVLLNVKKKNKKQTIVQVSVKA